MKLHLFSGLILTVKGKAVCQWIETYGGGKSRSRRTYEGSQEYLNSVTNLFGSKDAEVKEVPIGKHTYNFECLLPEPIPYSVEGRHGYIRYKVEAILVIPWGFDLKLVKPFTVLRNEDLSHIRFDDLRNPCSNEENKVFCCWLCKSDPLFLKVQLPRTGFGVGEKIRIHVEMVNRSSKNITATRFVLRKIEQFNSVMPFKKNKIIESTVSVKRSTGVRAGKAVTFDEFLKIPENLATSNNRLCTVFQIKYELKFTAYNDGVGNQTDLVIPITIGTSGFSDFPLSPLDDLRK